MQKYEQISCDKLYGEHALTHLYHVDNMVRQPENAKHHHNSQDELLAADLSTELGLPQTSQDEDVAGYDDCIRKNESCHCLRGILKPHLHTGGKKKKTRQRYSVTAVFSWCSSV